jgi:ParB family chromosome partitioning protein
MVKRPKGLGRGLDALLGDVAAPVSESSGNMAVTQLQPGKYQPRSRMDETALAELADSIKTQGLMQPVLVRPVGPDKFEIIAGERRWRAAQMAGLTEIPVLIRDVPDETAAAMALIENIQREDLNPLEQAQGIQRLIRDFSFTHEQAAQAVSRSRSATSNLLRLLNLTQPVQTMLMAGDLDMGHARALLAVDAASQINLANQIVGKRLSVRETERLVAKLGKDFALTGSRPPVGKHRDLIRLEERLSDALAAKVDIQVGRGKKAGKTGTLTIHFGDLETLQGLVDRLAPEE